MSVPSAGGKILRRERGLHFRTSSSAGTARLRAPVRVRVLGPAIGLVQSNALTTSRREPNSSARRDHGEPSVAWLAKLARRVNAPLR
jgi:hypothetical protein